MAYNYEDKLVETIKYIADSAVAAAPYDKTIQCTIMSCEDESTGKYKVQYQDSIFYAYTENTGVSYINGSNVYILLPNGDISKEKIILGGVSTLGVNFNTSIATKESYDIVGNNIINTIEEQGLCSYKTEAIILYKQKDE